MNKTKLNMMKYTLFFGDHSIRYEPFQVQKTFQFSEKKMYKNGKDIDFRSQENKRKRRNYRKMEIKNRKEGMEKKNYNFFSGVHGLILKPSQISENLLSKTTKFAVSTIKQSGKKKIKEKDYELRERENENRKANMKNNIFPLRVFYLRFELSQLSQFSHQLLYNLF